MRRRRKGQSEPEPEIDETPEDAVAEAPEEDVLSPRPDGPWDSSERTFDEGEVGRVDFGSLSIALHDEIEIRLQLDEASGQVISVLLVAEDGAAELKLFAAPRKESIWEDVSRTISADATRRGGTATRVEGPYGHALSLLIPVVTPEGENVTQASVVLGVSGPRWLLMASLFGRPAAEPNPEGAIEKSIQAIVVARGNEPMAPGDALPLHLPAGAERV